MKVIDLLNKIANGELAFEQEFKHNGVITDMEMFCEDYYLNEEILNNPIELIELKEEDKEIEKIDRVNGSYLVDLRSDSSIAEQSEAITSLVMYLNNNVDKINELIKAVNELKKGK